MTETRAWLTVTIFFKNGEQAKIHLRGKKQDIRDDLAANGYAIDSDGDLLAVRKENVAGFFVQGGQR